MSEHIASQSNDDMPSDSTQRLPDGLGTKHAAVLADMAKKQGMTEFQVMRQALALYQMVHARAANGEQFAFIKDGKVVVDEVPGIGDICDGRWSPTMTRKLNQLMPAPPIDLVFQDAECHIGSI